MNTDLIEHIAAASDNRTQLWANVLREVNVKEFAEVGVWKGDFAKKILKQCDFIQRYYMIDPWANLDDWNKPFNVPMEVFDDVYDEAMSKTSFASDKIVVLRGKTKDVIESIPDKSLDCIYIDGDHTLRGITIDLIKLYPKVKEGGLICGDDFINNPWQHGVKFEPTLVCPFSIYFAEAMDLPIYSLPFKQFLIKKETNSEFRFHDLVGQYGDISLNKLPNERKNKKSFLSRLFK